MVDDGIQGPDKPLFPEGCQTRPGSIYLCYLPTPGISRNVPEYQNLQEKVVIHELHMYKHPCICTYINKLLSLSRRFMCMFPTLDSKFFEGRDQILFIFDLKRLAQ